MDSIQARKTQVELFDGNTKIELQGLINGWLSSQEENVVLLFINYTTHPTYSAMIIYYYEKMEKSTIPDTVEQPADGGTSVEPQPSGGSGRIISGGGGGGGSTQ